MGSLMHDLNTWFQILDNAPISIVVKAYELDCTAQYTGGIFVRVSKTKAAHHGVDIKDMLGKTDFDFFPEDEARRILEDDLWVMINNKPIYKRIEQVTYQDGKKVWKLTSKFPRYNEPQGIIITGIISVSTDISETIRDLKID